MATGEGGVGHWLQHGSGMWAWHSNVGVACCNRTTALLHLQLTLSIAKHYAPRRVVGLDIDTRLIRIAWRNLHRSVPRPLLCSHTHHYVCILQTLHAHCHPRWPTIPRLPGFVGTHSSVDRDRRPGQGAVPSQRDVRAGRPPLTPAVNFHGLVSVTHVQKYILLHFLGFRFLHCSCFSLLLLSPSLRDGCFDVSTIPRVLYNIKYQLSPSSG